MIGPLAKLVLLGCAAEAACLVYLFGAPQLAVTPSAFGQAAWPPALLAAASLPASVFLWLLAAWSALYLAALQTVAQCAADRRTGLVITAFAALQAATLFLTPAQLSTDVYFYAMAGRKQVIYHQTLSQGTFFSFPDDPLTPFIHRFDLAAIPPANRDLFAQWGKNYGPLWTLITRFAVILTGPDALHEVVALKALVLLVFLTTLIVMGRALAPGTAESGRDSRWTAFLCFAWNPLVLIEAGAEAHNDMLVTLLVVVGLIRARRDPAAAAALFVLAAMVKTPGLIVLGTYLVWLWFHARPSLPRAAAGAIATFAASVAIFGMADIVTPFALAQRVARDIHLNAFHGVMLASVVEALAPFWKGDLLTLLLAVQRMLLLVLTVGWGAWLVQMLRKPATHLPRMAGACGGAMVLMFLFISSYFWSWYMILPLACLAFDQKNRLMPCALAMSLTTLCVHYLEWRGVQGVADTRVCLTLMYALPLLLAALAAVPRGAGKPPVTLHC